MTTSAPIGIAAAARGGRGAVALAGAAVAVLTAAMALTIAADMSLAVPVALGVPAIAVPAAVAALIALRRPGNRLAWVLAAHSVLLSLAAVTEPYARYALETRPGALPGGTYALVWQEACWPTLFVGAGALAFLFPDGRLPGPRWRPVAAAALAGTVVLIALVALDPGPLPGGYTNPLPEAPDPVAALRPVAVVLFLAGLAAGATAAVVRLRRSRGIERLQMLWLALGALLLPAAVAFCIVWGRAGGDEGFAVLLVSLVAATAPPVATGIAVLRYDLLDVERVLSRALLYGILSAVLAAVCIAVVLALDALLNRSGVAGVAAAAVAALAVQPVRHPLQRRIDRWVHGDRSDPHAAVTRLSRRLGGAIATADVLPAVVDTVHEALRPGFTAIRLEGRTAAVPGAERGRRGRGAPTSIPLRHLGDTVAHLEVEPAPGETLGAAEMRLLEDLAGQAAIAAHTVRLQEDLQESRERLVAGREEERRRLRHDLHDGLGPTLAAMVLGLGSASRGLREAAPDAAEAGAMLDELREQARDAVGEIRRIVDGLGPASLDELGLVEALRVHGARLTDAGGPVVTVASPAGRPVLPAAVEVAAYRIACEALTNAARHSDAAGCDVTVRVGPAGLAVTVRDDGTGMTTAGAGGVGLGSMRERAAELGGTLAIDSVPGRGTTVRVELPLVTA